MKLRNKVLISISAIWILFLALSYIGSRFFLLQSFLTLEQTHTENDLDRIDQALDQVLDSLSSFTNDWSHWNDVYAYMQGKNPTFIPNNLNKNALTNSHINLLSYWDIHGSMIIGTSANTTNKTSVALPEGIQDYLYAGSPLLNTKNPTKEVSGYVLTKSGIMLVASSFTSDGDKSLPANGFMINGRNLDTELINQISKTTKLTIQLVLTKDILKSAELEKAFDLAAKNPDHHNINPINSQYLQAVTVISDVNQKPIAMFVMTTPRSIYLTGVKAIDYYLKSFLALGVIFSLFLLWLLHILIIRRLEKLDTEVANISDNNALNQRVSVSGHDELSTVSIEINHMLDIIQASQDKLELRVEKRTQELQDTNLQLQQEIFDRKTVERELIVHKEHLVRLAHYDNLTALPNRVFFNEILNKAISHAKRHHKILAILFVDLDRFKNINDAFGHTTGDLVLKEMGTRFSKLLRAGDILARLGGDEYIILLNDISDPKFSGPVAEKILKSCSMPVKINTHEFFLTTSIGISVFPNDGESLEDLQKNADMAMYKAKRAGGATYQYYSEEMDVAAHEHIKLESALRKALQQNEFIIHYQPQLSLKDGKIKRVEALLRWKHPELGLVSPATFIPLAEETGLIMPIGEWVLHQACMECKAWHDEGYDPITVAVNISPKQFHHQDVAQTVADALKKSGLQAKYLEVEITETTMMDNVDIAIAKLEKLHAMGVHISVDDFGTGYTSINYLRQFPVSTIKIDQTFVKGIPDNQNDIAITSAVIALGHNLGLEVIAEGVETIEQMQFLTEHQCDLIQGYFLSRPLPSGKVVLQFAKRGEVKDTVVKP